MRQIIFIILIGLGFYNSSYSQQKIFLDNNNIIRENIDSFSFNSVYLHSTKKSDTISFSKITVITYDRGAVNFYNKDKGLLALGKYDAKRHHNSAYFFFVPLALEAMSYLVYSELNAKTIGLVLMPLVCVNSFALASYINLTPKQKNMKRLEYASYNS